MHAAEKVVRQKWRLLKATMDERQQRLWAGAEAGAIGFGGVAAVARATGLAISTVRKGRDEASPRKAACPRCAAPGQRRRFGASDPIRRLRHLLPLRRYRFGTGRQVPHLAA